MPKVDTLQLAVWSPSSTASDEITVTRFRLPHDAHDMLEQWCRDRVGRKDEPITVLLRSLSEILAWFVPEVAFMRHEKSDGEYRSRLSLYLLGDWLGNPAADLRERVQVGLAMWLSILYPAKPASDRDRIAATALGTGNWERVDVSTRLRDHDGACAVPEDGRLWDVLAARAVTALNTRELHFRSGESRILVMNTPHASPYGGVELVAFPPKQAPNAGGLWSEVITVSAASFPERAGLHVLVRASIRNWGPVRRYQGFGDPTRSLDVFTPCGGLNGHSSYRHTSFSYRAKQDMSAEQDLRGRRPLIGWWEHREDQRVFDLLHRLSGRPALTAASLASPVLDADGVWVLPRLGSIHQDKYLAGGTGVPWPDRRDIVESLDAAFAAVGFTRAAPMSRISVRMPVERPFSAGGQQLKAARPLRRLAVLTALRALGNKAGILNFYVFHRLDASPKRIVRELEDLLGKPAARDGLRLRWKGGLRVHVLPQPSGVLSEQLVRAELSDGERTGFNAEQQNAMLKVKQDEANREAETRMAAYVSSARGDRSAPIACAILEMPASLKDDPRRDPFAMARRALARHGVLPQVVLVGEDDKEDRYRAAVRDCFRMLGVLPTAGGADQKLSPAALTIIQRNDGVVGGGWRKGHAFPVAARVRDGFLECALPQESGEPEWLPYSLAALRIFSGNYGKFARNRQEETLAKFNAFFSVVLEQIGRHGATLLLAEMETVAHKMSSLQNGRLVFDRIQLGNRTYQPADLPNLRILRISPDAKKQPYYYHDTDNKWTSGLFRWGDADRTVYGLKAKPRSVSHESSFASQTSRHVGSESNGHRPNDSAARVSSQLDELCAVFMQPDDDPLSLAALAQRLRGAHAQYDDDTSRPFPLHELRLLGGGVTL